MENGRSGSWEGPNARVSQRDVAALYDRLAPVYDLWARLTESRARARAIDLARIRDGESVLEVAVGTGFAFLEIVRRNRCGRNAGVDLSPGMLARARRRLGALREVNWELDLGSALDLPFENGAFDLLVNNYMFDLLGEADMDQALREFKRVLKPGGRLVLVNMTVGERPGSGLYERLYRLSPRLMGGCRGVRLEGRLRQYGFTVELREYRQQLLFPSEVIAAHA
jgi:ubiquinone/menaquinone biosynthesis C-methylase UbiE